MNESESGPVRCKCGAVIGHKTQTDDGGVWLRLEGTSLAVGSIYAKCVECGADFHWRQASEAFYRLMRHYNKTVTDICPAS